MGLGPLAADVPFVGRVDVLVLVRRLLDGARSGTPRIVLVTGEAGVGKSRLLTESMAAASAAGVRVLVGTCHEDVAIPYLPVATALRTVDHDGARRLAPSEETMARAMARDDGEDHRVPLFLGATAALVAAASEGPVLLVLDDVHWADQASAELIRHLVLSAVHEAAVAELPLMVILSARGPWPDGVPRSLARLPREATAVEVRLEEFGVVEVHAMVLALTGARPRSEVTEAILEATGGNPLLMRGVITRNAASRRLVVQDGEVTLAGVRTLTAPTDLDDEIRIELSKVDDGGQDLLALASVVGDGEAIATLHAASDHDLSGPLADVVDAGLLRLDGTRYHFAHPQMRHVLYEDLRREERARLHLRVAEAVESSMGSVDDGHALTIAHHLHRGGADPHNEQVSAWALRAGDQAWATGAWDEARRAYALALRGAARSTLEPQALTEVLLRTGVAAYYANDDTCTEWLREAADLAEGQGDVVRRAEALLLTARFRLIGTAATVGATPPIEELESLLPALEHDPSLRARTLTTISDLYFVGLDHAQAATYAQRAAELLEAGLDDQLAVARVSFVLGLQDMSALRLESARGSFARAAETGDEHLRLAALTRSGLALLVEGRLDDATDTLGVARAGERRLSSHAGQQLPSAGLAAIHVLRGDFASAERLAAEVVALYSIQEYAFTPGMVFPTLAAARIARGDVQGAHEAIREWRACGGRGTWRYDSLLQVLAGDVDAVARELRTRRWPAVGARNLFTIDIPCLHVLVGVAIADADLVRTGLPALLAAHERGAVVTIGWPWVISRVIADGHAALGEDAAAERWYQRASTEASDGHAAVELGLATLGRARLALSVGRTRDAATLAATSASELDAIDALLLARDARALAESGGAEGPTPRDRFILFTDIVASTELNVRAGDERYTALVEEHDRLLRARLRRHDGVEHAHTGDGLSAWFASAESALECAFGIHADLARASAAHPELPVRVRMGISVGRPVHTGERLFGLAVVTSARICALAGADQVLVTDEVRLVADGVCAFRELGPRDLKGLPGTHVIHEAVALSER
jgi:class 3 adenylate cyclase